MAQVFDSSLAIGDDEGQEDMNDYIDYYWGKDMIEKIFPIPLWKLKQLFNAFPSADVALKVSDITSRTLVDAEWIAFDENLAAILENDEILTNYSYYILKETDFDALRLGAFDVADESLMFVARIGRNDPTEVASSYYVFFCIADTVIKPPFGAGEGVSTGFKVPSPG